MASADYVAGQAADADAALAMLGEAFASTDAGLLLRGRLLGDAARIDEALADVDRALAGDPEWDRALVAKAQLLAQARRTEELRAVGDKLLACRWEVEDTGTEITRLLVDAGREDDVIAKLRDVVERDPDAAWPRTLLAELLRRAGDNDAALELLDRAVALAPTPYAVGTRGQVLLALGREEEAVADLQQALADDPSQIWALFDLARGLRTLKRDVEAAEAIDPYLLEDQRIPR